MRNMITTTILEKLGVDPLYVMAGILALMLLFFIIVLVRQSSIKKQLKIMEQRYDDFMRGKAGISLEDIILTRFDEIDKLKKSDVKKTKALNDIIENLDMTYQKLGIVKYDAFNEMGGKLSFALALLTKENDGFVINAVHSREGCYTYVKEIVKGESYIPLADEEQQALEEAVKSDNFMLE